MIANSVYWIPYSGYGIHAEGIAVEFYQKGISGRGTTQRRPEYAVAEGGCTSA